MSTLTVVPQHTQALLSAAFGISSTSIQAMSAVAKSSYATLTNTQRSNTASNILSIKQRWDETFNAATPSQQAVIKQLLVAAKAEFRRRNPNFKVFSDLTLVMSNPLRLTDIHIDTTMQRELNIKWVIDMLNDFIESMVVPIQIYKDSVSGRHHAWDGQHTVVLLWLIATEVFGQDPATITVPTNLYSSVLKSQIRNNFIRHNGGAGKLSMDAIDIFLQMVYGVRVDGSKDPVWIDAEAKQQQLEKHDLFVTAAKFNNVHHAGAITRLQEINKMSPQSVGWLCQYLVKVGCNSRPADEKEMVMMGMFFDRCYKSKIKVDDSYIDELAGTALMLWNADFDKNSVFWAKADAAYKNWHNAIGIPTYARFNKEPVHGMPFLIAQLRKSFSHPIPNIQTGSEFVPAAADLF